MDLAAELARRVAEVEAALSRHVPESATRPGRLHAAMRYSLEAGGKRLRPVLVVATAELFAAPAGDALPAAAAVECLHTYSLIHDDLPCLDNDDLRRGRPTAHRAFDEATALLAGDALLTQAFVILSTAYAARPVLAHALTRELADAAGSRRLIGGQMEDVLAEKRAGVTADELDFIHLNKTAAMIEASLAMGGLIVGASALLDRFGSVVDVIERDGFTPDAKVTMIVEGETPATMAKSTGLGLLELPTLFELLKPDVVVSVGDRFETMATAIASAYMNIPVAHTMGGEINALHIVSANGVESLPELPKDAAAALEVDYDALPAVALGVGRTAQAVAAGDALRKVPDQLKASGADAATIQAAWERAYSELAWADTLAKGTAVSPQAKFLMGVAALSVGQGYLSTAGDPVKKVTDEIKATKPMPDAAKQKAMLDKVYPEACANTNKANDYFVVAQLALPAGASFAADATRQVMGSLMQLNGYVEQMTKAYCKK